MRTIDQVVSLFRRRICASCVPRICGIADRLERPEEVGPEVARGDDVCVHAEGRELPRSGLRERVKRSLGAVVRAEQWHAREGGDGADIQDVAGALGAERGEQHLDDRNGAEQVRLELRVDVIRPACSLFWFLTFF